MWWYNQTESLVWHTVTDLRGNCNPKLRMLCVLSQNYQHSFKKIQKWNQDLTKLSLSWVKVDHWAQARSQGVRGYNAPPSKLVLIIFEIVHKIRSNIVWGAVPLKKLTKSCTNPLQLKFNRFVHILKMLKLRLNLYCNIRVLNSGQQCATSFDISPNNTPQNYKPQNLKWYQIMVSDVTYLLIPNVMKSKEKVEQQYAKKNKRKTMLLRE